MSKESKCFAFGSVSGCREECPVLIDGDCELYTSAEHYNTEMELAALRATVAEKDREIVRLNRALFSSAVECAELSETLVSNQQIYFAMKERAEKAEAENAALRARLNRIEEAYKKYKPFFNASSAECDCEEELWQAIKATCEVK